MHMCGTDGCVARVAHRRSVNFSISFFSFVHEWNFCEDYKTNTSMHLMDVHNLSGMLVVIRYIVYFVASHGTTDCKQNTFVVKVFFLLHTECMSVPDLCQRMLPIVLCVKSLLHKTNKCVITTS